MLRIPDHGWLIDSLGLRKVQPWERLKASNRPSRKSRYSLSNVFWDCHQDQEQGCAVLKALDQ
ncbi:MAG: hypothetical protein M2R45_03382 [Verrucomicrobia subdivision 3 bacterium]|nr:hypothetical protein [Limisphaerales bacterium]MCS1416705.1 hypothetical protein [Limisphaerales bacterium]